MGHMGIYRVTQRGEVMCGIGSHMPIRRAFWYSVDGDTRWELLSPFSGWRDRAVDAAEDYHCNHNGWDARWPLEIAMFETEDGPAVARFEVECEAVPQFYAHELPKAADAVDPHADGSTDSPRAPKSSSSEASS
jgi:hypothetical protein